MHALCAIVPGQTTLLEGGTSRNHVNSGVIAIKKVVVTWLLHARYKHVNKHVDTL